MDAPHLLSCFASVFYAAAYMLGLAVCGVAASQFLDVATNNFSRAFIVSSSFASAAMLFGIWILVKVPERTFHLNHRIEFRMRT